ncbi:MAG: TonB-dependent receptor, partial [Cyclobacteriaceae bacterium]|nr:TonB-dependent receptor [Cyclobacteriaceae bacterium]
MRKLKILSKTFAIAGAMAISYNYASAQDDETKTKELPVDKVVVTGTKFDIPVEKSGKTIYKLSSENIEKNAGKTVADLLNEVPGIQIDGSLGNRGTNVGYYVRAGRDKNTLVLIDGVPLNDPSGVSASYDLRFLPIDQIESIEVLKGGLSTLYGTGASAGVISIKLKEAAIEPVNGKVGLSTGSYNTHAVNASVSGSSEKISYLVSGNYLSSGGFSVASHDKSTSPFDNDEFKQKNTLVKLGFQASEQFEIDFIGGYDAFEADYDGGAFFDQDNQQLNNQFRVGLSPKYTYTKGKISLKTLLNLNDKEFISTYPSHNKGKNIQLDLVQEHQISNYLKGLWGVNYQDLSFKSVDVDEFSDNAFSMADPYASLFFENNTGWNIHAGVRLNSHSVYGSKFVYNLNPSYLLKATGDLSVKIIAAVSTSYITPSLYQLYSFYGNEALTPEESLNYEAGFSLYLNQKLELNTSYFQREETNPIGFDFSIGDFGGYANLTDNRTVDGYETDIKWTANDQLTIGVNYAHAVSDLASTFYRIPKDKFGLTVNFDASENTNISAKYNYTSARMIQDFGT